MSLLPDSIMASHSAEGLYANALSRPFHLLATNATCATPGCCLAMTALFQFAQSIAEIN